MRRFFSSSSHSRKERLRWTAKAIAKIRICKKLPINIATKTTHKQFPRLGIYSRQCEIVATRC